ncbi:DUF1800 family protein [Variovorax sp. OV329]|uniref:DUF1800 domain-containing protein n=1 Tax=Variovorax sp. OV329 TaxID=1882825 RepID=UPI0008E0D600|nr:DUF1800 family protein [Variovorax sp. OV329]SFM33888.1 Uncharacterized conserved protein, DUF1800 family [Variovorax sp. OV329]
MVEEEIMAGPAGLAEQAVPARTAATAATAASAATPDATGATGPAAAAALAAAALLAACGGGGGGSDNGGGAAPGGSTSGSLAPLANSPTGSSYAYTSAKSDAEAARFLIQAQGYATDSDIAAVRSQGYLPWLAGQFDAAPTQSGWDWFNGKYQAVTNLSFDNMIWAQLMGSSDGMRKRMALALSEIFVVSGNDIGSSFPHHMMAQYWDTLVAGVTGNFRTLLEDISLNPAMGHYLNTKGNQKENSQGRQPDENYAREVMQLMTIGLVQLDSKGQPKTAGDGTRLDSYTQDDVTNLARVFTGYDLNVAAGEENAGVSTLWTTRPMALFAARHSTMAANFLGASVPGGTDGKAALKIALDTLHGHPNVGPFIGKQLIQRLVTSNPSPDYVGRVTAVFENNGAGVRGDMRSVFAAVVLDNEARGPAGLSDANFGRLREPMLRLVQWGRTFGIGSALGTWGIGNTSDNANGLGQSPLRSPSVFNFFRPGYVPPSTAIAGNGMVAPEFQLVNETTVGGYLNFLQNRISIGSGFNKDVIASYNSEKAIVLDASALVDRLNLLMCGGQLSKASTDLMKGALATPALTAASTDANKMNRIYAAVLMVMGCPEYLVQK